jgi:hypothetical protein
VDAAPVAMDRGGQRTVYFVRSTLVCPEDHRPVRLNLAEVLVQFVQIQASFSWKDRPQNPDDAQNDPINLRRMFPVAEE